MRVLLITFGTEGDVRPFVALAQALHGRGHEVAVSSAPAHAGLAREAGVDFLGFGEESYDAMRAVMEASAGPSGVLRQYPALLAGLKAALDQQWAVARAYAPDVIVFHPKPLAAPHIAERLGVPGLLALPLPVYHPTPAYPSAMLPNLPRPLWAASYRLAAAASGAYRGMLNRFRGRLGLPPSGRRAIELVNPDGSPRHTLYAYSPSVLPVPHDYPPTAHVTGYWFQAGADEEPPADVRSFVDAGTPDLYLGFGSMAMGGLRDRLSDAVAEALQRTGVWAVVGTGWGGLDTGRLPGNALGVGHVPHTWLLPRVRAVVHHGGAGTVAAGLRAGRPALVCPLLGDQPFWAARLRERGVAVEPLPMKRITGSMLAERIEGLLSRRDLAQSAESLGRAIRREDGVGTAVDVIERVTTSTRPG